MKRLGFAKWMVVLWIGAVMAAPAPAAVIISAYTGGIAGSETCRGNSDTHGWKFTVGPTALSVVSVGHYDKDSDGLGAGVEVGIWDSAGVLQGSGIVPAGVGATLINDFRYASLAMSITLLANQSYTIGSRCVGGDTVLDSLDLHGLPGDSITVASDFTSASGRYNAQVLTMLSEPTNNLAGLIHLGPNFEYVVFQTHTPTASPTTTPTSTPSATPTSTASPSSTPTATPSDTPSATPTSTPTHTPSSTPTSTPTQTATNTPAPIGSDCGDDAQCASGFCVDDVCCDSRCNARGESCNFFPTPGFCAEVPTAVPATSSNGLLVAGAVLLAVAALALRAGNRIGNRERGTGVRPPST